MNLQSWYLCLHSLQVVRGRILLSVYRMNHLGELRSESWSSFLREIVFGTHLGLLFTQFLFLTVLPTHSSHRGGLVAQA